MKVQFLKHAYTLKKLFLMNEKFAVVIPCYNEEENLNDLIQSCEDIISKTNGMLDFILVNNGSTDSTGVKLKNLSKNNLHFLNIEFNLGMGNGIREGLEFALKSKNNYKYYGWTHADLQIPAKSIIQAIKIIESQKLFYEKIYIRGRRINRNTQDIFFTILMAIYTSILKKGIYYDITGLPVLISNNLIENVISNAPDGFSFDVFTYIKAKEQKAKIIRFKVDFSKRKKGNSSWNTGLISKIKMSLYYIKEIWKI